MSTCDYEYFYDLAVLVDEYQGYLCSKKEIAQAAYDYVIDFEKSKQDGHPIGVFESLMDVIAEYVDITNENDPLFDYYDTLNSFFTT